MPQGHPEYKVISHSESQFEANLNRLAKEGWRVLYVHYEPTKGKPGGTWRVLLERLCGEV
jgi:hypothetical protein